MDKIYYTGYMKPDPPKEPEKKKCKIKFVYIMYAIVLLLDAAMMICSIMSRT